MTHVGIGKDKIIPCAPMARPYGWVSASDGEKGIHDPVACFQSNVCLFSWLPSLKRQEGSRGHRVQSRWLLWARCQKIAWQKRLVEALGGKGYALQRAYGVQAVQSRTKC